MNRHRQSVDHDSGRARGRLAAPGAAAVGNRSPRALLDMTIYCLSRGLVQVGRRRLRRPRRPVLPGREPGALPPAPSSTPIPGRCTGSRLASR